MIILILVVLGICLGSFVNAFVWRFHEQEQLREEQDQLRNKSSAKSKKLKTQMDALSISKGRSMCVHCHHELAAKDLIPVVSYIALRGKCRYCRKPIQDSPMAELVTPLLFVLSYVFWPVALSGAGLFAFCMWLVFLVGFVVLGLYDLRWYELPHKIVLPLIGLAFAQAIILSVADQNPLRTLVHSLLGAIIGGGIFYFLYAISPKEKLEDGMSISKWIGGGDITLGVLLGLLVGGPEDALLLIFVASFVGTIVAVPLLIAGKATRTSHMPFGPFLLAGCFIVRLWGTGLVAWYTGQFIR